MQVIILTDVIPRVANAILEVKDVKLIAVFGRYIVLNIDVYLNNFAGMHACMHALYYSYSTIMHACAWINCIIEGRLIHLECILLAKYML